MQHRFTLTLFSAVALALAGCADHAGSTLASGGPSAPINQPDTRLLPDPGENTGAGSGTSGGTGSARNSGGSSTGSGGTTGTGEPGSGGGTGEPTGGNSSGGGSNSGGQAGSPVPEPGTLLLFGTGLAGLAGASFRRRRRKA